MYIFVMIKLETTTVQTWARLIRAHRTAFSYVESALKKEGFPPLVWYDVLLELERAGEEGLRPYELENELLLKQYGVSRLVERIEKKGYIKREAYEGDGRGMRLIITAAGKKLRLRMWPIYKSSIEEAVGSKLTSRQAENLSELLAKIIT